jgi:hypothetical protein
MDGPCFQAPEADVSEVREPDREVAVGRTGQTLVERPGLEELVESQEEIGPLNVDVTDEKIVQHQVVRDSEILSVRVPGIVPHDAGRDHVEPPADGGPLAEAQVFGVPPIVIVEHRDEAGGGVGRLPPDEIETGVPGAGGARVRPEIPHEMPRQPVELHGVDDFFRLRPVARVRVVHDDDMIGTARLPEDRSEGLGQGDRTVSRGDEDPDGLRRRIGEHGHLLIKEVSAGAVIATRSGGVGDSRLPAAREAVSRSGHPPSPIAGPSWPP